ncbi:MAG: hypothetical protein WCI67_18770 [Chloroflexales bacterium]
MSTVNSTTTAAPRLADTDWARFRAEAEALAAELKAATPHLTARAAGDCAAAEVEARYAAELAAQAPQVCAVSDILDDLVSAVDAARAATDAPRWRNAIDAAFDHLLQVETVEVDAHGALTYASESGHTYHANGACQCRAFLAGQPCKHRAAARLVKNALEHRAEAGLLRFPQPETRRAA